MEARGELAKAKSPKLKFGVPRWKPGTLVRHGRRELVDVERFLDDYELQLLERENEELEVGR